MMRLGWGLAAAVSGLLALFVWLRMMGEYFSALDDDAAMAFPEAIGLGLMALLAAAPLAYVIRRRHWIRPTRPPRPTD